MKDMYVITTQFLASIDLHIVILQHSNKTDLHCTVLYFSTHTRLHSAYSIHSVPEMCVVSRLASAPCTIRPIRMLQVMLHANHSYCSTVHTITVIKVRPCAAALYTYVCNE